MLNNNQSLAREERVSYKNLLIFNDFFSEKVTAGATLKGLGNFSTINGKEAIKEFKKVLNTDYFFLPTPQHEDHCWYVEPGDTISNLKDCDALFMRSENFSKGRVVTLGFTTGDCPIITGNDGKNSFIIHSGLYGSKINICGKLLEVFTSNNYINIEKTKIVIWPGICPDCYEVGQEWEKTFSTFVKNGYLNLRAVILRQIIEAGVRIENINMATNLCSYESESLFSHRGGDAERNLIFIKTII